MNIIRVLVFGATGTGKTSVCNVLTGHSRPTSNGPLGQTSKTHRYNGFNVHDVRIEIIDTVGLHETDLGTVPAEKAVLQLVELLENSKDGFNLLIHVVRASRITQDQEEDYRFFFERMTQQKIPIILAITGCENESPMTSWVERNWKHFERFAYLDLVPGCFASGGPLESHFSPLRKESRESLIQAIKRHALPESHKLYGEGTGNTFAQTLTRVWNEFVEFAGLPQKYRKDFNESAYTLMKRMGVSDAIAKAAIAHIPDLVEEAANKLPFPMSGKIIRSIVEGILEKIGK
jgi:GTPase SAR1 family protein